MYVRALEKLHIDIYRGEPMDGRLHWLANYQLVLSMVEILYANKPISSKSAVINAISSILKRLPQFEAAAAVYRRHNARLAVERNDRASDNTLDEGKEYVLRWPDLTDAVRAGMASGVGSPRDRMVVKIFMQFPPRRCLDWQLMRVGYGKGSSKKYNWLDLDCGRFVFNAYKTCKVYGQQIFSVPPALLQDLRSYAKGKDPGDFLFQSAPGLYYVSFSPVIKRAFEAVAGTPMTANDLRHSYISSWLTSDGPRTVRQRNELAKKMAHTRAMQDTYLKLQLI
jgi:hypothetical protein